MEGTIISDASGTLSDGTVFQLLIERGDLDYELMGDTELSQEDVEKEIREKLVRWLS